MAEKSFIWDAATGDGNSISESDSADMFKALMGSDGVLMGYLNSLEPEVSGSTFRIKTGWGLAKGHPYRNDSLLTKTPTTPSVGTTGHRIVLRADTTAQTVRVVDVASADGTSAIPAEATDDVTLGYFTITTGGVLSLTDARERANRVPAFPDIMRNFMEANLNRFFFFLGPPAVTTIPQDEPIGLGFTVRRNTTPSNAILSYQAAYDPGMWINTVSGSAGLWGCVVGPYIIPGMDPVLLMRVRLAANIEQQAFWGFKQTENPIDENELIGFRVTNNGNVIGVCSTSAGETTRDSGATGAVEAIYTIQILNGGSIVRFFKNGVQIGADVTTNISTSGMKPVLGMYLNTNANAKNLFFGDVMGWTEN